MDDISLKKKEIEEKLRQEQMVLSFLKESISKSSQLTGNMLNILTSFENRIHKLEDTIVPVHKETVDLQRRQASIDKTISSLDHVISYHHVYSNVEHVIRDAPTGNLDAYIKNLERVLDAIEFFTQNNPNCLELSIDKTISSLDHVISYHHVYSNVEHVIRDAPTGNLDAYIKNLERVLDAIEFFTQNNPNCLELSHLSSLRDHGRDSLEREFRTLLNRHSKPVPAEKIMEMIGTEEDPPKEDATIEHLSEKIMEDLSTISHWLLGPGKNESVDFMSVYAQIRSNSLHRSLQGFKDIITQQPGIFSSTNTVAGKFKAGPGTNPTRRMSAKRKDIRRIPSKQHGELGHYRRHSALALQVPQDAKEEEDEIDSECYIMSCKVLLTLMQSERELMRPVIPEDHQNTIFDKLIQTSLESFITEGEGIVNSLKRSTTRHNYSAVRQVFPILKQLRIIRPEFDDTLRNTSSKSQSMFGNLIHSFEATGAKALDEFADGIKHGPDKHLNMPRDGTVHELTRNTLILMEQLLPFIETVGHMLATQQEEQGNLFLLREPKQLTQIAAEYVKRVLGALGLNLELKARVYEAASLSALFLLNNYHYILKALQRSGLLDLLRDGGVADVEKQYQELVADQKNMYQKCWSKVLHYLLEMEKPISLQKYSADSPQGGKLKEKQRQNIKDKFKGFNTEFEEIHLIQKTYSVPDEQLRDQLRKENVDLIIPIFKTFMEKYQHLPFTKNPEKYIKYSVENIATLLSSFFDVSA